MVTLSRISVLFSSHSPLLRLLLHVDENGELGQSESKQRPWLCQQGVAVTVRVEGALGPGAGQLQTAAEAADDSLGQCRANGATQSSRSTATDTRKWRMAEW